MCTLRSLAIATILSPLLAFLTALFATKLNKVQQAKRLHICSPCKATGLPWEGKGRRKWTRERDRVGDRDQILLSIGLETLVALDWIGTTGWAGGWVGGVVGIGGKGASPP